MASIGWNGRGSVVRWRLVGVWMDAGSFLTHVVASPDA